MANDVRRISVELSAKLGNYATTMAKATAANKALNDELETLDRNSGELDKVAGNEKTVGDESEKTAAKVKKSSKSITDDFDGIGKQSDKTREKVGDDFDGMGGKSEGFSKRVSADVEAMAAQFKDFDRLVSSNLGGQGSAWQSLQKRIDDTKTHIEKLRSEFRSTGNAGAFGDIKSSENDLKKLMDFASSANGSFSKSGAQAGSELSQTFSEAFSGGLTSPAGLAGIGGFATVAAPVISGVVATAVTAGFGLGITGAGILAVKDDPNVRKAFSSLGSTASAAFTGSASSFELPLVSGFEDLQGTIEKIKPELGSLFSAAAPDLRPLLDGIGGFAQSALPEFVSAMQNAEPIVAEIGKDLPALGASMGDFFNTLSQTPGAVSNVDTVFSALDQTLVVLATGIHEVGSVLAPVNWAANKFGEGMGKAIGWLGLTKAPAKDAAKAVDTYSQANKTAAAATSAWMTAAAAATPDLAALSSQIGQTTQTADTLAGAMTNKIISGMLNSAEASNNFDKSLVTLGDTIVSNGGHLDAHVKALKKTETGAEQNKDAVLGVVQANLQVYNSQIAAGISAQDAAKKYDDNTTALKEQLKAAGYLPNQIQALIGQYENVPDKVNTDISMNGLTDAINNLDDLMRQLNGLPPLKTITVQETYRESHVIGGGSAPPTPAKSASTKSSKKLGAQGNRWGGVYTHAADGLLSSASLYSSTNPGRYMIAEPQTGGEAFVPRHGNYARSAQIIDTAAQWYGGRFAPNAGAGAGGGASSTYAPSVTNNIYPQQANWTPNDYIAMQNRTDTMLRVGRRR